MKVIAIILLAFISSMALAGTGRAVKVLPKLAAVEICKQLAVTKLETFAKATISADVVRLVYADYRLLNPVHYADYQTEVLIDGQSQTVQTKVQLNRLSGGCY